MIKNLGPKIGQKKIDVFLSLPMNVIDLDFATTKVSIEMLADYSHFGIDGRDATLLATLKRTKTDVIATHDFSFQKIEWLNVIDPIK